MPVTKNVRLTMFFLQQGKRNSGRLSIIGTWERLLREFGFEFVSFKEGLGNRGPVLAWMLSEVGTMDSFIVFIPRCGGWSWSTDVISKEAVVTYVSQKRGLFKSLLWLWKGCLPTHATRVDLPEHWLYFMIIYVIWENMVYMLLGLFFTSSIWQHWNKSCQVFLDIELNTWALHLSSCPLLTKQLTTPRQIFQRIADCLFYFTTRFQL